MRQTGHSSAQAMKDRLDAVVDDAIGGKRIVGVVVLVARDGMTIYRRAAGLADREANVPMAEDGIFRLASVTKPLVAAAAMRLVEQGLIRLDEPVTRTLPEFRPRLPDGSEPVITLRQLLTHTSGLSYRFMEPPGSPYHARDVSDGLDQPGLPVAENLRRIAAAPLAFLPGSGWRYSLAMDVLGAVMAVASGQSLPELVATLVTRPLGLVDTAFHVTDRARLVTPYADGESEPLRMHDDMLVPSREGWTRFVPSRIFDGPSYPSGGAGMAGTAADTLCFLEAIRTGGATILQPETVGTMTRPQIGREAETQGPGWGFGYGWAVLVDPAQAGTPQSAGTLQWGGAYGHSWFVDPAERLTIVSFTNTAFEGVLGAFPGDIVRAVYG